MYFIDRHELVSTFLHGQDGHFWKLFIAQEDFGREASSPIEAQFEMINP